MRFYRMQGHAYMALKLRPTLIVIYHLVNIIFSDRIKTHNENDICKITLEKLLHTEKFT